MKLSEAMEKATPGPLLYRARKHSDWGEINTEDGVLCRCNPHLNGENLDVYRENGVDPIGHTAALLAHFYNHGPKLLNALKHVSARMNDEADNADSCPRPTLMDGIIAAAEEVEGI